MTRTLLLLVGIMLANTTVQAGAPSGRPQNTLEKEAMVIVEQFAARLKPKLVQALRSGSPAQAIEICSREAPALARQMSDETGWQIKRVSLKPRNHDTAIPDRWERSILERFDRLALSNAPKSAFTASLREQGRFRFMKAQPVKAVCLNCHGKHVRQDVLDTLRRLYPRDQALGYSLNQIRGAFSLSRPLRHR